MNLCLSIPQPDLLPTKRSGPGEYIPLPIKTTDDVCGIDDVVDFVFDYVSRIWLNFSDYK
jgi:RNA-dependent RNA polymerase